MSTRTIVTVKLEVHDAQPYTDTMTTGEVRAAASKAALHTIACLNRDELKVIGRPEVTLVIDSK